MQLNLRHTTLLFALCASLTACGVKEVLDDTPGTKSPIELSVGGVDAPDLATKAAITDGQDKTMNAFDKKTKVFILMQSEKEVDGSDNVVTHDGYEYKGDRLKTLYTVARGDVAAGSSALVFDENNTRYWDDAHARSSQLTMWAIAQKVARDAIDGTWKSITFQKLGGDSEKPSIGDSSDAAYNTNNRIDWQGTTTVYPAIYSWSVGNLQSGHQNQDANTLIYQDLLFSNNIANYVGNEKVPVDSRTDRRLKFDFTSKKFPREADTWSDGAKKTEMKFYHAMAKITIQLKAGKGFKADGTDFKLANNTLDLLHGFNTRGLFNIKDGEFQLIHNSADITAIPITKTVVGKSEPYYTLEALAIPNIHEFLKTHESSDVNSRFLDGSSSVMMEITVDDNTYKITSKDLYDALMTRDGSGNITTTPVANATRKTDKGNYVPLEAGKNYVFTFTIGKQEINNLTAYVADWENVVAEEQTPSNARITLNVEDGSSHSSTSPVTSNMDIYRALDEASEITDTYEGYNWTAGYNTDGKAKWNSETLAYNTSESRWSTDWFWESNKTYYHFRTLSPTTQVVTENASGDYTTITTANCTSEAGYSSMAWGAPFLDVADSYKFTYSITKGFDGTGSGHQIYKAIGPTKDPIKVLMFHMMSGVHFIIKTDDTSADKVKLYDGEATGEKRTKLDLVGYYPDGKVLLGTGVVNADGTISTVGSPYNVPSATTASETYANHDYYFSAVPQDLATAVNDNAGIQLYITTPDHNQYIVNLKDVKATTINTNNLANPYTKGSDNKYTINRWYPGFKYTYSFTLKKKGIESMTATVLDWENVTADNDDVQIQ